MRILIAEDESDISHTYRVALESRNHDVNIANDGISCLKIYREELANRRLTSSDKSTKFNNNAHGSPAPTTSPYDVVVLDYKMPGKDGMEVAKEILTINPDQRIIFASAYVKETLENSVKELRRVVELLQKPFEIQAFIDTIEDKQVYEELKKIMINIRAIDGDKTSYGQESSDISTSRERMRDLFECLRKIQKNRTF
ncbi:MAG: response regulator [Thermoproteota archaeon]|nr:response regulator [Thermoproteota archaeon]